MTARRLLSGLFIGLAALGSAACDSRLSGQSKGSAVNKTADVDFGKELFTPEALSSSSSNTPATPIPPGMADPIVVNNAQIILPKTENVPSKNNGSLWQICTEGGDPANHDEVFEHPTAKGKMYRTLHEGDFVKKGDLVALLDDRVARAKYNAALVKKATTQQVLAAAAQAAEAAKTSWDILSKPGISSVIERERARTEYMNALKAQADAEGAYKQSFEEENVGRVQLEEHELRASIDGRIKTIYRKPGESIKELEPVVLIENLNKLRIEGSVPVQYLPFLDKVVGKTALLEPAAQLGPRQELLGHDSVVTGVAISKDAKNPVVVSGSEDKTLRIWDHNSGFQKATIVNDSPIRAVACTGAKSSANLACYGADDGYGYVVDLDTGGGGEAVKKTRLKTRHKGRVNAVGFSPDGAFVATADDKEVIISNTANGEKVYGFTAEHRGPITTIQFTPQSKLVSVGRDKSIRLWNLREKGAKLERVLDHRSGNVDVLGVSPDGQRVMFDLDRALQVKSLYDQRVDAILRQPSDSSQFSTFAVFSNDGQLAFTGGTHDNPLGVWKLPQAGYKNAYQRVRLAMGNSVPTCIASSQAGGGFVAVGTQDNRVVLFERPKNVDLDKQYSAKITTLDQSIDSSDRRVRIWAELPNPGMPLIPGDTLTMVLPK